MFQDVIAVSIFSSISCQTRGGDIDVFFQHENHAWPPSLAENNSMCQTNTADLIKCIESIAPTPQAVPKVDVQIIDGAQLVHRLDPKQCSPCQNIFRLC